MTIPTLKMSCSSLLAVLCILILFTVPSKTQAANELVLECPEKWDLLGSHCYYFINVHLSYQESDDMCKLYGAKIVNMRDEVESMDVGNAARDYFSPEDSFWISNKRENGKLNTSDYTYGYWQIGEPLFTTVLGDDLALVSNLEGLWAASWEMKRHATVCRAPACVKDMFRCNNGKCINRKWECDGTYDCEDHSDESNCPGTCTRYYTQSSGSINTGYTNSAYCKWTIEADPWRIIRLDFRLLDLEKDVDILTISAGGPTPDTSYVLETLTGPVIPEGSGGTKAFYSHNNYLIIELRSDASITGRGFDASWTPVTSINRGHVDEIQVTETIQELAVPFQNDGPRYLTTEWDIRAKEGEIITIEIMTEVNEDLLDITSSGIVIDLPEEKRRVTISNSDQVQLMVKTVGKENRGFVARVWAGCDVDMQATYFTVKANGHMPHYQECAWKFTNSHPQGDAKFKVVANSFDLGLGGQLEVYDGDTKLTSLDSTEDHFVGDVSDFLLLDLKSGSYSGSMTLTVTTRCTDFPNVANLHFANDSKSVDHDLTYFVNFTCRERFSFAQEGYVDQVTGHCSPSGKWTFLNATETRYPSCQEVHCGAPPQIDFGFINGTDGSVKYGGEASYLCANGFSMDGSDKVTCQADGTWSEPPVCSAASCLPYLNPTNAAPMTFEHGGLSYGFGTVIKLECNTGYELVGAERVICLNGGKWSSTNSYCKNLRCPIPRIHRGAYATTQAIPYGSTASFSCDEGYRAQNLYPWCDDTSLETGDLNNVMCLDFDECLYEAACPTNKVCVNIPGGFECICKPEYNVTDGCNSLLVDHYPHCNQDLGGNLVCSCTEGFELFRENGQNGYQIPSMEDGLTDGDVLRINRTCIRKTCHLPSNTLPGAPIPLTDRTHVYYQETVHWVCPTNYLPEEPSQPTTCVGNSLEPGVKCVRPICQVLESPNSFSSSITNGALQMGESGTIHCYSSILDDAHPRVRNVFCTINPDNPNEAILQGDDPWCPIVTCGDIDIPGLDPNVEYQGDIGETVTIVCDAARGFTLEGNSSVSGSEPHVVCKENGKWLLGSLHCEGPRCSAPPTPAGTRQVNPESYAIDKSVFYECINPSLTLSPPDPLVCIYNTLEGKPTWSGPAPNCLDETPPVIDCPGPQYFDLYDVIELDRQITAEDNIHTHVSISQQSGPLLGVSRISDNTKIVFEALDNWNVSVCEVDILLKDRTAPDLTCSPGTYSFQKIGDFSVFNTSDLAITTSHPDLLSIQPPGMVTMDPGETVVITASVVKENTLMKSCSFVVTAPNATCEDSRPSVANGRLDFCTETNSVHNCILTCEENYVFPNSESTVTAMCYDRQWTSERSFYNCFPTQPPVKRVTGELYYGTPSALFTLPTQCETAFNSSVKSLVEASSSVCGDYVFHMEDMAVSLVSFVMAKFEFTLIIGNYDDNEANLQECIGILLLGRASYFQPSNLPSSSEFDTCAFPWAVVTSDAEKMEPQESSCGPRQELKEVNGTMRCIPCLPGKYWDSSLQRCAACTSGTYTTEMDRESCDHTCADDGGGLLSEWGRNSITSEEGCPAYCPVGFISFSNGLISGGCIPCGEDQYWLHSESCTSCPSGGSTKGKTASTIGDCHDPCQPGFYSISGYEPCTPCPINFYQANFVQTSCDRCGPGQTTHNKTGAISIEECVDFECDPLLCNEEGVNQTNPCFEDYHTTICVCKKDYYGTHCEHKHDRCNPNPCYNEGECVPNDGGFECHCPQEETCTFSTEPFLDYAQRSASTAGLDLEGCKSTCKDRGSACKAVIFESVGSVSVCWYYPEILLTIGTTNEHGDRSMRKTCSGEPLFSGDLCQDDLVDDCQEDTCSSRDLCRDLVNDAECVCPPGVAYTDKDRCVKAADPCGAVTCFNEGTCQSFGDVRFVCQCRLGFTGELCETNLNDCFENTCIFGGTCLDITNDHICRCPIGRSGKNCEVVDQPVCEYDDVCQAGTCHTHYVNTTLTASCACPDNYEWRTESERDNCFVTNHCDSSPCKNDGTCTPKLGGYTCNCPVNYWGAQCQHGGIDCTANSCLNGGICRDQYNSFTCDCPSGFEGLQCQFNINDCADSPCESGRCVDLNHDYRCDCNPGYGGRNCTEILNMCDSYPCRHGGNCTSLGVNSYRCDCLEGFDGDDCQNRIHLCQEDVCQNDATCYNLIDRPYCRCKEGTAGDTCEIKTDMCELFGSFLCVNGRCENGDDGNAQCVCAGKITSCEIKQDARVAFTNNFIGTPLSRSLESCKDLCLNTEACKAIFYSGGMCALYDHLNMMENPGAAEFAGVKECQFDPHYSGDSCELLKDVCHDNPCGVDEDNMGMCSVSGLGYSCNCDKVDNYKGDRCQTPVEVCQSSTCPSGIQCRPYMDQHGRLMPACLCQPNEIMAGSRCKDVDHDFDLIFPLPDKDGNDNGNGDDDDDDKMGGYATSARGFFTGNTGEMTVALWVACLEEPEDWILSIAESDQNPDEGREGYVAMLELYNDEFFTHRYHENQTKVNLETDLSQDFTWHFIAISLDSHGRYQLVQDYNTYGFDTDGHQIDFRIPKDKYMFVHLGHHFSGYISQVHVWNSVVPLNELVNTVVSPLSVPSPSNLALAWSLYRHNKAVTPVRPSHVQLGVSVCTLPTTVAAALEHCGQAVDAAVDKKPPKVIGTCEKEVFLAPLNDSNQVTLGRLNVAFDDGDMVTNVPANALSFGAYDVVFASADMQGNVGICMTRVHVSGLKEDCAFPAGSTVQYYNIASQTRMPTCQNQLSVPVANYFACGKLRSYNYKNIYQLPNRVVCGTQDNVYITVKMDLVYSIPVSCSSNLATTFFATVDNILLSLSFRWSLCDEPDCSDARVSVQCDPTNTNQMLVEIVVKERPAYYQYDIDGERVNYTPEQTMQYLVQSGEFDASSFLNAQLEMDSAKYNSTPVCRHGRGRVGEHACVRCGPGSYYSDNPVQECKLCPIGTFSNETGTVECLPCGEGKTTLFMGSSSMDNCTETCPPGQATSESGGCAPCRQNFYQSMAGQYQCLPCPPATGTDGVGAQSIQDCISFCAPGKELIDRVCVDCHKGFYRIGNLQDRCKPCPANYTTHSEASSDRGQCDIPLCPPGSHVIGEGADMECEECAYGTYQPHEAKFDCMPCGRQYTTNHTGSSNQSDCIFVCEPGYEQDGPTSCRKCPRGHYKEDTLEDRFKMCHPCPLVEYTTEMEGSVNRSQCVVKRCMPGSYYNKTLNWCFGCPRGTYQVEEQKDSCEPCQPGYNTRNESSVSDDACEFVCDEGSQVDNSGEACEVCPRGTYKNKTMVFGACRMCENGMSTLSNGAISNEECTVAICPAGHIVSDDHSECVKCPLDHYQPQHNPLATVQCTRCTGQTGTNHTGATSDLDCLNICFEGQGNMRGTECESCPRGEWNNGNETMRFEECQSCPMNMTTQVEQGATSLEFCNIPDCHEGQMIVDNECSPCAVDQYQPILNPFLSTECLPCPPGEGTMDEGSVSMDEDCHVFCVAGNGYDGERTGDKCELCERGTWNNGNQTMRWSLCEPCPDGYTTAIESGATDPSECSIRDCQPGSFFDRANGDACTSCPIGTFQSEPRMDKCEECPTNKNTSFTGSDSITDCLVYCSAGTEDDGDANCVPCQADHFKADDSFSECLPCVGDVTSEAANRKACTKTHCDVGRFKDGESCRDCDQGYFKEVRGNEACVMCPGNTTTPDTGATSESMCSVTFCEPGFFSPDDQVCSPCLVGYFKEDKGNDVCQPCEGAFTTSGEATAKQTDCDLPICPAGEFRVDKECSECPKGTYQSEDGMTECVECDEGYTTMQTGSTEEEQCRRVCPAGQFRVEDSNTCQLCGLGYYQSEEGQAECDQCPGNHTTFVEDASSQAQCYVICPIGYRRSGRTTCTPCPTGSFQNMTGQAECHVCPDIDGYSSSTMNEASERLDQCLPLCTQGLYLIMAEHRCEDCAIGTYSETIGLETECETCRQGTTTLTTQSKNENDCSYALCSKGYYRQPNEQDCQMCGYGTYQPMDDTQVTECIPCGNGRTSLVLGATTDEYCLKDCNDGEEFNQETQECTPCPVGQYRIKPDLMRCYYCKDGETTLESGSSACIATEVPLAPVVPMTYSSNMFFGANSCQNQNHIRSVIRSILMDIFRSLARRYTGLCSNRNCDNLAINFVGDCGPRVGIPRRRKRQTSSGDVETGIRLSNVDSRLTDTQTGQQVDPETVIQDALRDMTTQRNTLESNGLTAPAAITVDVACQPGSLLQDDQKTCKPCAAGTYHNTNSDTCEDVPKGSYTDTAGSAMYKDCPTGMTTAGTGSTSVGDCDGLCSGDDTYCVHGNCEADANGKSACVCFDYYKGAKCDEHIGRAAVDDDNEEMIGGIAGGIGAVLFLILVIVACFAFKFKSRRSSKHRSESTDSDSIRELKSTNHGSVVPYVMNPVFSSGPQPMMVQDPTMYHTNQMDYFHPLYNNSHTGQYEGSVWET